MKTIIQIIFLTVFVAFISFSCEKDITLDIKDVETKYAVEGWIITGETPMVILSSSFPAYGTINFYEQIANAFIDSAIVKVSNDLGDTVHLERLTVAELSPVQQANLPEEYLLVSQFLDLPIYTDTTQEIIGVENGAYNLHIEYEDVTMKSRTTIPQQILLDSLSYEQDDDDDSLYTVYLHLSLQGSIGNYIRYATQRNNEPFYFPSATGANWSDATFQGATHLKLPAERGYSSFDTSDVNLENFGTFVLGDEVTIMWNNIDRETYDFWFSIDNDGGDTPFSSPSNAKSNVEGALGIFAGYNQSFTTITIQ